ncbi:NAD-dependent epimerase/dehydratase family protein [Paenibacillus luteus]|uniref:polysaccharide biosynthesis C-terminal domain-containing protein n=1 Tax=Paenibacillus luteus TaxID=2545753 RepID=UPI001143C583|nr:NAD-dependent epimerase/dehydratase family protein [Paenibacillus luteus]
MKILVTGANGFIGKNLIAELKNRGYNNILRINRDSKKELLNEYASECEFVFHLAGVNRPQDESEFMSGNYGFTVDLLELLNKHNNKSPILITSSIQAEKENPYGASKKAAEDLLFSYCEERGSKSIVYRLPNLFGKWSKPNYNSVVATFCYNLARDLEIKVNDKDADLNLCYIDDVIDEFIRSLEGNENKKGIFCYVPVTYNIKIGELADKLQLFSANRRTLIMPSLESPLDKALYGTYLSYLEENNLSYKLKKNSDDRGWLAEFIKSDSLGQIFISKTKPGITRGNHWHHTKVEKFLVIQGEAIIKLRNINTSEILEYKVSGEIPEVVDIPVGYSHSITNAGLDEVITLFWASEIFNVDKPDTYFVEV